MIRRSMPVACICFVIALRFAAPVAAADDDRWIGREFRPKPTCRPIIGTQEIPLERMRQPFRVQKVQDDWLWTGQAWVKKRDVVAIDEPTSEPIEEFTVGRNGHVLIVPVEIDGREYPFILDTGAPSTAVDTELKAKLLTTGRTLHVDGYRTDQMEYRLPSAVIGKSKLPVIGEVVCLDLKSFRNALGRKFYGFLGMTFLKDKRVCVDFDAGKVSFLREIPNDAGESFSLSYTYGRPMLDFELAPEQTAPFLLDTGCWTEDCGAIESATFDELHRNGQLVDTRKTSLVMTVTGKSRGRRAILKHVRIGSFEHTGLGFRESDINMLGLGYLSRYRVTFDFPNDRIYLQKGERFGKLNEANLFGATVIRIGRDTIVQSVAPLSRADWGGLHMGDHLLSVDGIDCGEFSLFELQKLFAEKGPRVRLIVQDDNEPRALEISR